ncbi:MAG: hypothetical protein IJT61_05055 [Bacteroidales bacterium]|nr:hypothetical protein [Bacteroidales bacterium]
MLFSAVPAGNFNGSFNNAGNNANFWSSSQNSSNNAWNRNLNYNNAGVNRNNNNKNNGFSVRCVRDGCRKGQRRCAQRLSLISVRKDENRKNIGIRGAE